MNLCFVSLRRQPLILISLMMLVLAGCGPAINAQVSATPTAALDANGKAITIPTNAPQRIISLGATDSEMLAGLGLDSKVIAVDSFTDYPSDLAAKPKITDPTTGAVNIEQVAALHPDLVLSYGGETKTADQQLESNNILVVDLPAVNLTQSLQEILLVGRITHADSQAQTLVNSMQQQINAVKTKVASLTQSQKVKVYLELDYSTPGKPFVFGQSSFGDELVTDSGGINIFGSNSENGGYPQVDDEAVIGANPDVIILTEDPLNGGDPSQVAQRPNWSSINAVKNNRVYNINADLMQRPGPRITQGLQQLAKDIYPNIFSK